MADCNVTRSLDFTQPRTDTTYFSAALQFYRESVGTIEDFADLESDAQSMILQWAQRLKRNEEVHG